MTVILGGPSSGGGGTIPPPITPVDADARFVDQETAANFPYPPTVVSEPSYGGFTVSSNRGSIELQGTFEALVGWVGLGPVKRTPNRIRPLGLDGSVRNRRRPLLRAGRTMGGPVHVQAATALERAQEMRKLLAVLSPFDGEPCTLTGRIETGELISGEFDAVFEGGDEWMAAAAWDTSAVLDLEFDFPDPRLYGETRREGQGISASVPFFPIGPVKVTDSTSFGTPLGLDVGGERPTPAVWTWTGPGTKLTVTGSGGQVWEVDLTADPLLAGEQVVVTTDTRATFEGASRVAGPAGADYWQYLSKHGFFPLRPEKDTVTIQVTGTTGPTSRVELAWRPAVEAIL